MSAATSTRHIALSLFVFRWIDHRSSVFLNLNSPTAPYYDHNGHSSIDGLEPNESLREISLFTGIQIPESDGGNR